MFESLYSTFIQFILHGRLYPDFSNCDWVFSIEFSFQLEFLIFISAWACFNIYASLMGWLFKILSLSFHSALCSCFLGHHSGFLQLSDHTPSLKDNNAINAAEVTEGCCFIDLVSLLSCEPHLPRGGRTNSDLSPPKPVINQGIPHRLAYSQFWWRHFSIKIPHYPQIGLCCVKLTKTNQDLLQCPMWDRE